MLFQGKRFFVVALFMTGLLFNIALADQATVSDSKKSGKPILTTWPIPIRIDREYQPSPIYISLVEKSFNKPISRAFADAKPGSAENTLRELMEAIAAQDFKRFRDLSENMNEEGAKLRITEEGAKIWMSRYQQIFRTKDPVVKQCFYLDDMVYFVLKASPSFRLPYAQIILSKSKNQQYRHSFQALISPAPMAITSLLKAAHKNPKAFKAIKNKKFNHMISLMPLHDEETETPVYLSLDGSKTHYVLSRQDDKGLGFGDKMSKGDKQYEKVLRFYGNLVALIKQGKSDELQEQYGERSRRRVKFNFGMLQLKFMYKDSTAFFVTGDSPLYVLFYNQKTKQGKQFVRWAVIQKTKDKGFQVVNYNHYDAFADLLKQAQLPDKLRAQCEK